MIITESQLKQIIREELEAYLIEEGFMQDFSKKAGKWARGAALAGTLATAGMGGAPPAQAAEPSAATTVVDYLQDLKTEYETVLSDLEQKRAELDKSGASAEEVLELENSYKQRLNSLKAEFDAITSGKKTRKSGDSEITDIFKSGPEGATKVYQRTRIER